MSCKIIDSILDYKFLSEIGNEVGEYSNYDELLEEVRKGYRRYGIIFISSVDSNKYYIGVREISRREAIIYIIIKNRCNVSIDRYLD